MNAYEGLEIQFHSDVNSEVGGLSNKIHDPTALSPVPTGRKKCLLLFLLIHALWIKA